MRLPPKETSGYILTIAVSTADKRWYVFPHDFLKELNPVAISSRGIILS